MKFSKFIESNSVKIYVKLGSMTKELFIEANIESIHDSLNDADPSITKLVEDIFSKLYGNVVTIKSIGRLQKQKPTDTTLNCIEIALKTPVSKVMGYIITKEVS